MKTKCWTRRNKYNARPVEIDGRRFASAAEGRRYSELCMLQKAGHISELECQPSFTLLGPGGKPLRYPSGRAAKYIADFRYLDNHGHVVIEDVKGDETPVFKLKRAIMESMGHNILILR